MQEINNLITLLGQENLGKAIPVITAFGGAVVVILQFMFNVINAQSMNEIEKVFLNRKQRTNLKLLDLFMVVIVLGLVYVILMLVRDDMIDLLLALGFIAAFLLILIYCIYRIIYLVYQKCKKVYEKWKYHSYMDEVLFVSEFLIGAEMGKLTYYNTQGLWRGILVCMIAASATSFFMVIISGFFEDGPSKVYFYGKGGRHIYIFYKLDDDFLLCGDNRDIKKAKISLIPYENFKKGNHKLAIEQPNNQNH